jgi:hypothetical protein
MCRPAGAHFDVGGIGYKYAAPLGLADFAALNVLPILLYCGLRPHKVQTNIISTIIIMAMFRRLIFVKKPSLGSFTPSLGLYNPKFRVI